MSTYSVPSTSYIFEPTPWLIHTVWGRVICQLEVTPPARARTARWLSCQDRGWRSRKICSCSATTTSNRLSTSLLVARVDLGNWTAIGISPFGRHRCPSGAVAAQLSRLNARLRSATVRPLLAAQHAASSTWMACSALGSEPTVRNGFSTFVRPGARDYQPWNSGPRPPGRGCRDWLNPSDEVDSLRRETRQGAW